MSRRRAPRPISAALQGLNDRIAPAGVLAQLQMAWPQIVGDAIAAEASPVSEREGTVTVACSSSMWAAELRMMEADLLARLNETLGDGGAVAALRLVTRG